MADILVLFYSRNGMTEALAREVCHGIDISRVHRSDREAIRRGRWARRRHDAAPGHIPSSRKSVQLMRASGSRI